MSHPGGKGGSPPQYEDPRIIPLGWVKDPKKRRGIKLAYGPIIPVHRELDTPCWRWAGNYVKGYPVIRNHLTCRSPIKLLLETQGKVGHITSLCGHKDCVRPSHHEVVPWPEHMQKIRHTRRDSLTGRFTKDTKEDR